MENQQNMPMKTVQTLSDPLYWGTPASYRETFHPMGLALSVESNDPLVLEAARESFGRYAIGTPGQRSEFPAALVRNTASREGLHNSATHSPNSIDQTNYLFSYLFICVMCGMY